ncbi:endolytic transglycosylase MltG [Candidatus Parcubacteria bacterium]|nr:endolytic transglycosylase MltG [Candidatus Parcubacteria bacterium]
MMLKRKNRTKKEMNSLKFAFSLLGFFILTLSVWFLGNIFLLQGDEVEDVTFPVKEGDGLSKVAFALEKEGLIASKTAFALWGLISNKQRCLMAGDYELSPKMTSFNILKRLTTPGQAKKVLIFEGWSIEDIASLLEEKEISSQSSFLATCDYPFPSSILKDFPFLAALPEGSTLEGFLFPDSYELSKLDSSERVVRKMLFNFKTKVLESEKVNIENQLENKEITLLEALTMASLIEKEVKTYQDKQIVAGILWKRLRNGWPLQVDATLVYLTGKVALSSHKEIDSLYNTYKNKGLPPGPICNPGLESILAALNPEASAYWYYLSTKTGQTIFSQTLDEHNINRGKYLR